MTPPLFLHRLGDDLCLQSLFGVHLLETPVLFFELFKPGYHRPIYAAKSAAPFVKQRRALRLLLQHVLPKGFGVHATSAFCIRTAIT
jgi:hypothetical protein